MLSTVQSPTSGFESFRHIKPRRYSFRNFGLCPDLQKQIKDIAIRRISADLLKSLLAIKRNEFVEARNRVDVPHGLFGLNLESFYTRRKENIVYLDVLKLVCREALEQAKVCIILDDLQEYVRRLFVGYHSKKMVPILKDIGNSQKLLSINEIIVKDYKKNTETLAKLHDKLNAFNVRERNATAYMNNQVWGVMNNCIESELVLDPIEFRYKLSFHLRTTEQSEQKLRQVENQLRTTLDGLKKNRDKEEEVSDCIRMKQRMDIDMLKAKLDIMTQQYDRDYENLDSQITYKLNSMEAMQAQHRECLTKMEFFAVDKVRLLEWMEWWELKKQELAAQGTKKKKKPGKKKGDPKDKTETA